MRLYKRKGVYYLTRQSTGGKQVRRSLKTHDKRIAEQRAAKLELTIHEAKLFGKEPPRSFKEMIVNYLEPKQSKRGFERLQYACRPLIEYFGDSDVTKINESHVEGYINWRSETVSDGTLRRELGALSAAFNHAIKKQKWRIENPCLKAEIPKEPKGRVRYLTRPEAKRLLQAAELPYLADFIELNLNTGCRKGELLNLKWENVDFSTRLIYLDQTKSGEWQTVPINEAARQVLVRRMQLRDQICPNSRWVFFHMVPALNSKVGDRVKNIRRSFKSACNRAGIENFRPHDLRHTFASWLVMEGVPLFEVSKLLRHASIQMTERYAHLAPDYLHDAVASLGFSAQFQHTTNSEQNQVSEKGLKVVKNGGRGWI